MQKMELKVPQGSRVDGSGTKVAGEQQERMDVLSRETVQSPRRVGVQVGF